MVRIFTRLSPTLLCRELIHLASLAIATKRGVWLLSPTRLLLMVLQLLLALKETSITVG